VSPPRTMSERKRALLALAGVLFPRVGDCGVYHGGVADDAVTTDEERTVEVLRLSASGVTIWTRFVHAKGMRVHGEGRTVHRWVRLREQAKVYVSNGTYGPVGTATFR